MYMAALLTATMALSPAADKDTLPVRKFDDNVLKNSKVSGQNKPGVTSLASEEDIAKAFDKDVAAAVAKVVDFSKEEVVYVSYETSGPPYGRVGYHINAKDKKVEFYVAEPKGGGARGEAFKFGRELYVVPKGTTSVFGAEK